MAGTAKQNQQISERSERPGKSSPLLSLFLSLYSLYTLVSSLHRHATPSRARIAHLPSSARE